MDGGEWGWVYCLIMSNSIMFSYFSKYIDMILDKHSKIQICFGLEVFMLLLSAILTTKRRFDSRKRVSLSSLCEFSCFTGMLSLTYMHKPFPKLSLSCLNILYPAKWN